MIYSSNLGQMLVSDNLRGVCSRWTDFGVGNIESTGAISARHSKRDAMDLAAIICNISIEGFILIPIHIT